MSRVYNAVRRAEEHPPSAASGDGSGDGFGSSDRWENPLRTCAGVNVRPEAGQSITGLTVAWRAQLEKVVTRLYLLPDSPRPKILVFLAPEIRVRSRSVCAHSGDLLAARVPVPVCLLEANPNVVAMRERLDLSGGRNLADLIGDPELDLNHATVQVPGRNLWLLTGGLPASGGAPLSQSERLPDRMNELRMRFGFVMVDAPPLNASGDALTLAQISDGAVLILPAGASRESARRMKKEIAGSGVTLLGAILVDQAG